MAPQNTSHLKAPNGLSKLTTLWNIRVLIKVDITIIHTHMYAGYPAISKFIELD